MVTEQLPRRHEARWNAATRHPFLVGVRDGTVAATAFDTWLGQDHLFVTDLLRFQARLLARAPRGAQRVLVDGCSALVAELSWFEEMAEKRGLALSEPAMAGTLEYRRLLERLDRQPVAVALTALWVIERVYLEAWRFAAPGAESYRPYVAHWTEPAFESYVDALAIAADGAAADAAAADAAAADAAAVDGTAANGTTSDGTAANGTTSDGTAANGTTSNDTTEATTSDAVTSEAVTSEAITADGLVAEVLEAEARFWDTALAEGAP